MGDINPENGKIYMPSYCSISRLYNTYEQDMLQMKVSSNKIASESSFRKYIDANFGHVRFPTYLCLAGAIIALLFNLAEASVPMIKNEKPYLQK